MLTSCLSIRIIPEMNRSIWPTKSETTKKPWGNERKWSTFGSLQGKVLYISKDSRTSMKLFDHKDEVLYIQKGTVVATVADEEIFNKEIVEFRKLQLTEGDVLNIQAGCPYRLKALEDSIVVEISNGRATECVRFIDDYGRHSNSDRRSSYVLKKMNNMGDE